MGGLQHAMPSGGTKGVREAQDEHSTDTEMHCEEIPAQETPQEGCWEKDKDKNLNPSKECNNQRKEQEEEQEKVY